MSARLLFSWTFEGGGTIRLFADDGIPTEQALDMAEKFIGIKRAEIAAIADAKKDPQP